MIATRADGAVRIGSSFRDPAGFVFERDGRLFRQINACYRPHFERLQASGLARELIAAGLLVSHTEADVPFASADGLAIIEPQRIPFISYPFEWCFGQLAAAARCTLQIQRTALAYGMSLKDASAYNIQFVGYRPVLIDTLSFEVYQPGQPWPAYRQFCQHFLAPLMLMAHRDVRLAQLSRVYLDGPPLDLVARLLPWTTRLRPSALLHIHLHARNQARFARAEHRPATGGMRPVGMSALIDSLDRAVARLEPRIKGPWTDYYVGIDYPERALEHKARIVRDYLGRLGPRTIWDLGGNDGRFSRDQAPDGAYTVALDADWGAVEQAFRVGVRERDETFLPLVMDLTNPTPACGWAGIERLALAERGPVDAVMALALVHHLAIANQVPLDAIAELLAKVATSAIVEFVPRQDARAKWLIANRGDDAPGYGLDQFETAFGRVFRCADRQVVTGTDRAIYLFVK